MRHSRHRERRRHDGEIARGGYLPDPVRGVGLPDGARYALNHEWTLPGATLRDGDEVAVVLPVSGG